MLAFCDADRFKVNLRLTLAFCSSFCVQISVKTAESAGKSENEFLSHAVSSRNLNFEKSLSFAATDGGATYRDNSNPRKHMKIITSG